MHKQLAALLILAPLSAALAQDPADPAPNIVVEEPVFNFGEKDSNLSVEHTFEILNDGDLSLEITKTKTSCGCTVADISRKIIPPGESATLKAVLSLKNKRGNQRKTITIHSNDPDSPTFQLHLEGVATSDLTLNPERIFLSGISPDDEITRTVDITSKTKPIIVKGVNNPLSQIDASVETLREGHEYRLTVRTKPPLEVGRFQNHILVETEPANQPRISILVMGDVVGALAFAPQQIVLSENTTNAVTRYVVVRPGSQKKFTITKIELPNEMQSKTFPMGENGYRIQLQNIVPDAALKGEKVIIHTDVEAMPLIEIPFVVQEGKPAA